MDETSQSSDDNSEDAQEVSKAVRVYKVPSTINIKAKVYYKLIGVDDQDVTEPPAVSHLINESL